jgi:ribose transport system ATP-binding protein
VLQVRGISKSFPGVRALRKVDLALRAGEVHALCGENGAGKSTLMNILSGGYQPDEGEILLNGQPAMLTSPLDGKRHGILLIHQEISLVPQLTAAENVFLGSLPVTRLGRFDRRRLNRMTAELFAEIGLDVDPEELVGNLPIARQQMVEISRALAFQCAVVIFDEPTASLTQDEAELLFANIERLRSRGVAIVYISHKMKEIFRIADRVTVLRDGQIQGTARIAETDESKVTGMMIGRELGHYFERAGGRKGAELLRVENFSVPGFIDTASFSIREGEVLGLYGLVGAGRSELAEAVFGLRPPGGGQLYWRGKPARVGSARDAVALGMGFVPEDRKRLGLVGGLGLRQNISLPLLRQLSRAGLIDRRREAGLYEEFAAKLSVRAASPKVHVSTLSGGNQQKIVLAKWLATRPRLLILDEPTRGIDVGAKAEVHALITRLAEEGIAILLISSEMPEVMNLSHRILTISHRTVSGEFDAASVTEAMILSRIMKNEAA